MVLQVCFSLLSAVFVIASYLYFFWSLPLQATMFMINLPQLMPSLTPLFPYSIDFNPHLFPDQMTRLLVNIGLLGLFAIPHSIFARQYVKNIFPFLNKSYYRSFYVFKSSACLHLILKYWQPLDIETKLWDTSNAPGIMLMVYGLGWFWLVTSTFALDHFELFGLKDGLGIDVMSSLGFASSTDALIERAHYTACRHPIMLGFFTMFFAVPVMTINHLFFSVCCTTYILLAVKFLEEPDLQTMFGGKYDNYKQRVPMYCPLLKIGRQHSE